MSDQMPVVVGGSDPQQAVNLERRKLFTKFFNTLNKEPGKHRQNAELISKDVINPDNPKVISELKPEQIAKSIKEKANSILEATQMLFDLNVSRRRFMEIATALFVLYKMPNVHAGHDDHPHMLAKLNESKDLINEANTKISDLRNQIEQWKLEREKYIKENSKFLAFQNRDFQGITFEQRRLPNLKFINNKMEGSEYYHVKAENSFWHGNTYAGAHFANIETPNSIWIGDPRNKEDFSSVKVGKLDLNGSVVLDMDFSRMKIEDFERINFKNCTVNWNVLLPSDINREEWITDNKIKEIKLSESSDYMALIRKLRDENFLDPNSEEFKLATEINNFGKVSEVSKNIFNYDQEIINLGSEIKKVEKLLINDLKTKLYFRRLHELDAIDISNQYLDYGILHICDMSRANLENLSSKNTIWFGGHKGTNQPGNLSAAKLKATDFEGSIFVNIPLGAKVLDSEKKTSFKNCKFIGCDFSTMSPADFKKLDINGAVFSSNTKLPKASKNLEGDITEADLTDMGASIKPDKVIYNSIKEEIKNRYNEANNNNNSEFGAYDQYWKEIGVK